MKSFYLTPSYPLSRVSVNLIGLLRFNILFYFVFIADLLLGIFFVAGFFYVSSSLSLGFFKTLTFLFLSDFYLKAQSNFSSGGFTIASRLALLSYNLYKYFSSCRGSIITLLATFICIINSSPFFVTPSWLGKLYASPYSCLLFFSSIIPWNS